VEGGIPGLTVKTIVTSIVGSHRKVPPIGGYGYVDNESVGSLRKEEHDITSLRGSLIVPYHLDWKLVFVMTETGLEGEADVGLLATKLVQTQRRPAPVDAIAGLGVARASLSQPRHISAIPHSVEAALLQNDRLPQASAVPAIRVSGFKYGRPRLQTLIDPIRRDGSIDAKTVHSGLEAQLISSTQVHDKAAPGLEDLDVKGSGASPGGSRQIRLRQERIALVTSETVLGHASAFQLPVQIQQDWQRKARSARWFLRVGEPIDLQHLSWMPTLHEGIVIGSRSLRNQLLNRPVPFLFLFGDLSSLSSGDRLKQIQDVLSVTVELSKSTDSRNRQHEGMPIPVVESSHRTPFLPGIGGVDHEAPSLESSGSRSGWQGSQAEGPGTVTFTADSQGAQGPAGCAGNNGA